MHDFGVRQHNKRTILIITMDHNAAELRIGQATWLWLWTCQAATLFFRASETK